jgi:hypothetical protein
MSNDFIAGNGADSRIARRKPNQDGSLPAVGSEKMKNSSRFPSPVFQMLVIVAARCDEAIEMAELRPSDRRRPES